jgi:rhodanese-related sulfurtransferase
MQIISAKQLKKMLDAQEVVLIDVRSVEENREESIPGSICIPWDEISYMRLPLSDKAIVLHCKLGQQSATTCYQIAKEDPNLDIFTLEGGIEGWKKEGYQVMKH